MAHDHLVTSADAKLAQILPLPPHNAGQTRISMPICSQVLRIVDVALIYFIGLGIYNFYLEPQHNLAWAEYQLAMVVGTVVAMNAFFLAEIYDPWSLTTGNLKIVRQLGIWLGILTGLLMIASLLKATEDFSRVWFVAWGASAALGMVVSRFAFWLLTQHWVEAGRLTLNVALFGSGGIAEELVDAIDQADNRLYRVVGVFDERRRTRRAVEAGTMLGFEELERLVRANQVQIVVVTLPWSAEDRIVEVLARLRSFPIDIHIAPSRLHFPFHNARRAEIAGLSMLEVFSRPISGWKRVMKEAEDFILGALLLLLFLPLLCLIAAAVKLDSRGPVFFRQKRYGYNNRLIGVYKFRSMYHEKTDHNADTLVRPGDARVTRLGAFLRKTSLDELPQLLNVIRGEMSLVGPRPHALRAKADNRLYEDVVEEYAARHRVKPGITGWAQVNGWRGATDTEDQIRQRVEHDLYYIDNWSVMLDLQILFRTIFAVVKPTNAH